MTTAQWHSYTLESDPTGPLAGVRVLDMSRLVAGNMTSLQLADFGADVIKVEPLPAGDPLRAWKQGGVSTFWKTYARNKRSLSLDFRKDVAVDLLKRLLPSVDILIEGFRPGTLEQMGLGPDQIELAYPRLIVLRVSGFGQTGPYNSRPGFGTLVEGMSGFASRNGEADGGPLLPPLALADMIAGLYGSNAVMMALRARDVSGKGQVIDLSLLEAISSVLGPEPLDFQLTGKPKPRVGNGSNTSSPRNVYRSRDGHYIAISASIQRMAERLLRLIGREDMLKDPRYATNEARVKHRHEVDQIVGDWIGQRDRDELLALFETNSITAAPIYTISDIEQDKHFIEREVFVKVLDEDLGEIPMQQPMPRLSRSPGNIRRAAPRLGQHSAEVLAEFGISQVDINRLITDELVGDDSGRSS